MIDWYISHANQKCLMGITHESAFHQFVRGLMQPMSCTFVSETCNRRHACSQTLANQDATGNSLSFSSLPCILLLSILPSSLHNSSCSPIMLTAAVQCEHVTDK